MTMATTQAGHGAGLGEHERHGLRFAANGAMGEAACGMCAIVLAIIGLAHPDWIRLASIATIVVGAALVFEGALAAARMSAPHESHAVISTEFLGGIAGVILGILAILGIAPSILVAVAVIVFGASLIVGSIASNRFHSLHTAAGSSDEGPQFVPLPELTFAASGAQALVGLAAAVLGIIALLDRETDNFTLSLVALLVVGAAVVLMSTEIARRMMHILGR
jgi:hypothetical protein